MSPARWELLRTAVEAALAQQGIESMTDSRGDAPVVHAAQAADPQRDPALQSQVERLVRWNTAASEFLEPPVRGSAGAILDDLIATQMVGERFGPYRAIERIGAGGMGTVYRAIRDDDAFQRVVAVKVIRQVLAGPDAARRFHHERTALAQLSHPNIAGMLDGGTTKAGLPYLVLEYVDGLPLNDYCTKKALSIRERVQLFLHVCDAVRHAHQHLIIHRDLKPQNILVTAEGQPKLLDFGISRLVESDVAPEAQQTVTLFRALTPRYASPEQVRGESTGTSSDVYSLGVILYELTTGGSPRDLGESIADAIESFRRTDTRRPRTICPDIDHDLDAILMKALSTEPGERYLSAESLGDDLTRYLRGLPVIARPPSRRDAVLKWVRRNPAPSALIGTVAVLVLAFVTILSIMIVRLDQRRRDALNAQATAERINLFLGSTMEDADWRSGDGEPPGVRELLDRAVKRAGTDLAKYPSAEASVRLTVGRSYVGMGLIKQAEPQYRRALDALATAHGRDSIEYAKGLISYAEYKRWSGELSSGHDDAAQAIDIMRSAVADPATSVELADCLSIGALVANTLGVWKDAELWTTEAIDIRKRISQIPTPELGAAYERRAVAYANTSRFELADADQQTSIEIFGRCSSQRGSLAQVRAMCTHARILEGYKKFDAAEATARHALAIAESLNHRNHPTVCRPLLSLASALTAQQKYDQALEVYARASQISQRGLPAWHYIGYVCRYNYGLALTKAERLAEAEDELLAAYQAAREMVSDGHVFIDNCTTALHELYEAWGRTEEAEKWPVRRGLVM